MKNNEAVCVIAALLGSVVPFQAIAQDNAQASAPASVSIEEVDARATIAGCIAREAAAENKPQPALSTPKVRAEVERQSRDAKRLEECRRVLAKD